MTSPIPPANLSTNILLDSGDPAETQKALTTLGFLDGQTTNPSLVAHNPELQAIIKNGTCTPQEVHDFYKHVIRDIASIIPDGDISIEVYADLQTTAEDMFRQALDLAQWTRHARIKFPTNAAGIQAAHLAIKEGIPVNMTLVFSLEQAAAVHFATKEAARGHVVVSPFIGRLDDSGTNGLEFLHKMKHMYDEAHSHVRILAASVRDSAHLQECIATGVGSVTAPLAVLEEWAKAGMPVPEVAKTKAAVVAPGGVAEITMGKDWESMTFDEPLLTSGIEKFAKDWNELMGR